jgi:hypothetical protein
MIKSILEIFLVERAKMLYTASVSALEKVRREMKLYYVIEGHGNDVVIPDHSDLDQYHDGVLTWKGFRVNYLGKLMRPEAEEWMKRVSAEAVGEDVVLVSDEEDATHCYRVLLAEMMINMFSGQMKLRYMGELRESMGSS